MVKITNKFLTRKIISSRQYIVRRKNETDKEFLERITHLFLQERFVDQIMRITVCQNVSVIYLQNNMLRSMENLDSFPNLTHLYLQRNFLSKIDCLDGLQRLKKIYLGFNEITVFEGFANLSNICEIHIENQDLPIGEAMLFEPQTVHNLQINLRVLNISGNKLTTLSELKNLFRLEVLIANDNQLSDIDDVVDTLKEWPFLKKLTLKGNPMETERCYRDRIIFACKSLDMLDDKPIHEITRKFIEKLTEKRRSLVSRKDSEQEVTLPEIERKGSKNVTFREGMAVPENFITPPDSIPQALISYPAWQLRTNINPVNPKKFLPRPYWKKGGSGRNAVSAIEVQTHLIREEANRTA